MINEWSDDEIYGCGCRAFSAGDDCIPPPSLDRRQACIWTDGWCDEQDFWKSEQTGGF